MLRIMKPGSYWTDYESNKKAGRLKNHLAIYLYTPKFRRTLCGKKVDFLWVESEEEITCKGCLKRLPKGLKALGGE